MINLPDNALLDAAPDPMLVIDQNGAIVLFNRQAEISFGYLRSELANKPIEVLIPARYRTGHTALRDSFHKEARFRPMGEGRELYGQRKNGTEFPVEISLSPMTIDNVNFVVAAIRDASTHQAIASSLTGILERSLNEIFIFDATTLRFIQVNEGARRNMGYSLDELKLMTPVDIKPNVDHPTFERLIAPLRKGKEKITFSTVHQRKDGSTYPVEVHLQQTTMQLGTVFVAFISDITERQKAEQQLLESKEQLEERVTERTKELANATKDADNANSGKSRFLAAASHDLRQPLQSLGLYLSVLERTLSEDKQQEISSKMRGSLDTMGELLDALLDISKLDGGSIVPELANVELKPLLERIVSDNIQQANEKGLTITLETLNQTVSTDPALLARIVENFVTNAIRYTDSGSIKITTVTRDNSTTVSVTDTGVGIPVESIDKVFEEYYQLENQARDRRKGLGLGLSIVRHIARLLDHDVTVTSKPGRGSTFSVVVPVGENTVAANSSDQNNELDHTQQSTATLLLVDDDPSIIDATTMLLETAGASVFSAGSGEAAIKLLERGLVPDALITDYRLPGINGIELITTLRQSSFPDLPAVLITGDTSSTNLRMDPPANCTVLQKPINGDDLLAVISRSPDYRNPSQ